MAAIAFPETPEEGQLFVSGNRSWYWNGFAWQGVASETVFIDGSSLFDPMAGSVIAVDSGAV